MIQLQVFFSQVNELKEEKKKLQEEMETRNKEMEEMKDELEKNKAAASKSIWPFRTLQLEENTAATSTTTWYVEINQEEEQQQETCLDGKNKLETNTENSSSSDSQETSGDIDVVVNDNYKFISLRNESDQDKPLGGRQLKVQINNSEPITYTFHPSMELKAGKSVT
ncbi:prelamin-A/C-like isoform X2 [Mugil cephalus]|uniref:prelamin-A/C-like isoform X2 n=1 Tax=Mugil cephalus TaxID=48193 RepID=UPI001FB79172|nr:prelamin-A/C-like isoform X2 [Mugil cephalus]